MKRLMEDSFWIPNKNQKGSELPVWYKDSLLRGEFMVVI